MKSGAVGAIILAGGKGTRLSSIAGDLPKALVPIGEKPVLEHQILLLKKFGIQDLVLFTGYRSERISDFFGNGERFGVRIRYHAESEPLGTAGAVLSGWELLPSRFLVFYGDVLLNVDLSRFLKFHASSGADATLLVHPNDHPFDSDLVEMGSSSQVLRFHPSPHPSDEWLPNWVNACLYAIEKESLSPWKGRKVFSDFGKSLFPEMLKTGKKIMGYKSREYIKDMGTPDRYQEVQSDWSSGRVERGSFSTPQSCVFLDRDGTLTRSLDFVREPKELELLPGVAQALRRLNERGVLSVVVTNQPVVARGECSESELDLIHRKLQTLLGRERAYLDRIFYCPHHPDGGYRGERPELKVNCNCRKPAIGMTETACEELGVDLSDSWMIGDMTMDLAMAKAAGLRAVLVRTGFAGRDGKFPVEPDYEFSDLPEAVQFIVSDFPEALKKARSALASISGSDSPGELIAIGGLARSGKSTFARVIQELLVRKGLEAEVISLDSFIKPLEERSEGVRGRFDYEAASAVIKKLAMRAPLELELPVYDRVARRCVPRGRKLQFTEKTIRIVEGVVALDLPVLVGNARARLYIEIDESTRMERFIADRIGRGEGKKEAFAIYEERERDEHAIVRGSASAATLIIRLEKI